MGARAPVDESVAEDHGRVVDGLGDLPGAEKWVFFNTKRGSLGDLTPLEALRAVLAEAS